MAKAGDKTSTAWVALREAKRLVVEAYGDPELAERLLREWQAAKTVRWTCKLTAHDDELPQPTPAGFIGDPAFWLPVDCGRAGISRVEANFEEEKAWHEIKFQLFVIGPGVPDEPEDPPLPRAWGIEVSRADLLAKLPASAVPSLPTGSAAWALATARRLSEDGVIYEGMKRAEVARALEVAAKAAAKAGHIRRALKASYMEDELEPWGVWPLSLLLPKQK